MSAHVSGRSRMALLALVLAASVFSASARPSSKVALALLNSLPTKTPAVPTVVMPVLKKVEITTGTDAKAGIVDSECGPLIDLGSGVQIRIDENGVVREANAKTGAKGGCGTLFAQVESGTTTKVGEKDPLSAKSTTTIAGVKGIVVGISQSHTGALVPGQKGKPAKAYGSVSQSSALGSKGQKTTHAGSGTITTDGDTVTNTAGDSIRAEVLSAIKKNKCRKNDKGCSPSPTVPTIKPTLPPALKKLG